MASTLADEFLADFESGSDDEEDIELNDEKKNNEDIMDTDEDKSKSIIEEKTSLASISLLFDDRIEKLKERIKKYNENNIDEMVSHQNIMMERRDGSKSNINNNNSEENSYVLTVDCNNITVEITDDIIKLHKFVQDIFSKRFYDLESLVVNSLDYLKVVRRMIECKKLSDVDLSDLLPGPTIMVIKMSASNTNSDANQLTDNEKEQIIAACDGAISLDKHRKDILDFVASRMNYIAPNLSALVGTDIAAKLIGSAGGLLALSRLPGSTLQVLGSEKKTLEGFSTAATVKKHVGFIYDCSLVLESPQSYRKKVIRVLAPKCALAARVDSYAQDKNGDSGKRMKEEILNKLEKWQERPPAKQIKALPAPGETVRKVRGGKRVRKLKEKYAMTEYRKYAGRMAFGVSEETNGNSEQGFGMLGAANRVKLQVVKDKKLQRQLHHRQMQRERKQKMRGIRTNTGGSVSGIASSLAMTPIQGMELIDPEAQAKKVEQANLKYFGKSGRFVSVSKDKTNTQ